MKMRYIKECPWNKKKFNYCFLTVLFFQLVFQKLETTKSNDKVFEKVETKQFELEDFA